ncbi:MAG: hypothetical protein IJS69_03385 [Selenomonadaceae bacterium]|nr:hypothetical protein [Selenomonadaceae bacterium]
MEEAMASPVFGAINFLALGLSVVLLFAVAYLWSSNSTKSAQLAKIQSELQRMKRTLNALEEKVNQIRQPKVISEVPQIEPFGLDLSEPQLRDMTPLAPQVQWLDFVEQFNKLAVDPNVRGYLKKCEKFVRDNKLKILNYGGSMTFRPAIDARDSLYWAFKYSGEEYAVVPNPMNPCDEHLCETSGIKEIFELNYEDGTYAKYSVKVPAIFTQDPLKGWMLKKTGVVNLDRK